jgi:fumarylacetoacetase
MIDETHDPGLPCWVEAANDPACGFPIQNLPLGVFVTADLKRPRLGTAIGDQILPLDAWLDGASLNGYLAMTAGDRRELRKTISRFLQDPANRCPLVPQAAAGMRLPATIGDYTDFYASLHHATNVGRMLRPDQPLLPNYKWIPIAYHGRASSVVVSGTPIRRPQGQLGEGQFGACRNLDYELEVGAFVGPGNRLGEPIAVDAAREHFAGICLLNDWSARDLQKWEYQPLGPFLAKNFATSISPWLITAEALEPFRCELEPRGEGDPAPLPYLAESGRNGYALRLEVWLRTPAMAAAERISAASFHRMYWSLTQMITHHASNGCPLRPGDLIGSGTVSGPEPESRGCLLERTWRGAEPLRLANGEERRFLEDGDEVTLRGRAEREGFRWITLGECAGQVMAAGGSNLFAVPL